MNDQLLIKRNEPMAICRHGNIYLIKNIHPGEKISATLDYINKIVDIASRIYPLNDFY